jgi:rfaE bifunctional protein nucleotidyltransferase chain/domain
MALEAVAAEELRRILDGHREQGEKIVFTNGVFDLLHPGHIRYLREARAEGDRLVVAINSDSSARRLKGADRPVLPQHERAKILASLDVVDYVTVFDEDTPAEIIEALRPDVLVKGGDYKLDEIVGRDFVESTGGKVKAIPFVEGLSSSNIIDRIVRAKAKS